MIQNQMVVGPYPTETSEPDPCESFAEYLKLPDGTELVDVEFYEQGELICNKYDHYGTFQIIVTVNGDTEQHRINIAADCGDPDGVVEEAVSEIKESVCHTI